MNTDSLDDIAVFVEVVKSGSFTAAADRLSLSKSVVSKYVTRLERRLGARLLNRTTRRLSLTEAGQAFYARSRRALDEIDAARAEVSHLQGEPRGTLRINAPMSFGVLHVCPALPAFLARYPEITVDMTLDDARLDVVGGGFDVAIRISKLADSSLVSRRLGPCRHVVCAAPDYFRRHGEPATPHDLGSHAVLSFPYQEQELDWHFTGQDEQRLHVQLASAVTINNSLALRELLLRGVGLARIPTFVVGADIAAGRLQSVLDAYRTLEVPIQALYPHRQHVSPKVRAFVDHLATEITETPYWDCR